MEAGCEQRQNLHLVARFLLPEKLPSTRAECSEHRCPCSCAGVRAAHPFSPLSCQRRWRESQDGQLGNLGSRDVISVAIADYAASTAAAAADGDDNENEGEEEEEEGGRRKRTRE